MNAWIVKARLLQNTPLEFAMLGVPIPDWTLDDTIALQDVLMLALVAKLPHRVDPARPLAFVSRRKRSA